ncbi:MAG: cytochrome c [Gammaproteobacteria bacterium]|nr:cytochrome c [Gammaproteobacteria bacterium]
MHQSNRTIINTAKLSQKVGSFLLFLSFMGAAQSLSAQEAIADPNVTFADVAPILYENCIQCHNPEGGAPMSLMDFETAKIYAPLIKHRTGIKDRMGAMPPWYHERDIGLQSFKGDMSLSNDEIAILAAWADAGAPLGDSELVPPAPDVPTGWTIEPDFIVRSGPITVGANEPDWWGIIDGAIEIPLDEDRYVKAVQVREVNDIGSSNLSGRHTVGGKYIIHHAAYTVIAPNSNIFQIAGEGGGIWPVHEVGRNEDRFDDETGPLIKAGSQIILPSVHLHSAGVEATAHLEFGFELFPPGFEPKYERVSVSIGNLGDGVDIDIPAGDGLQVLHTYSVLEKHTKIIAFEPHLHAPGERMCLEAIWGSHQETLSCVGYDHNWVRKYTFGTDAQPLLPKGTIVHMIGWMNNSESNSNIPDARNWQGSGNRSVANMFLELGLEVHLTDDEFVQEMEDRVKMLGATKSDYVLGCPLCLAGVPTPGAKPEDWEE